MSKQVIENGLRMVVDLDRYSVDESVLWTYTESRIPLPPRKPDAVVLPKTVDEVLRIVRFANDAKIPIVTLAAGLADYGGSIPCYEGGIVMDFSLMRKIWEINEDELYAVVEPGVTIGQLQKELAKYDLTVSVPSAPHTTSILGNMVPQAGIGTWPNKYGGQEAFVRGVEAVLPTGDLVRTGSGAFRHGIWHHRNNLGADLTGLFVNSHGILGIVTKAALGVLPMPEAMETTFLEFESITDAQEHVQYIARKEWGDYVDGQNYMMSLGTLERYPYEEQDGTAAFPKQRLEQLRKKHNIPPYWFHIAAVGTEKVVKAKKEELDRYVGEKKIRTRNVEDMTKSNPWAYVREQQGYSRTTAIAAKVDGWRGGRMTFHSYAPISKWTDLAEPGVEILRKHGFETGLTFKAIGPHGYSSQLRFVTWYNKTPEEAARVRRAYEDIIDHQLRNGATIFRQHMSMERVMMQQPEFYELLKRIKKLLDPNRIMNPGLLGL